MYLLDTHILVWVLTRPERLSRAALEAVQTGPVAVSVASFWEMVNKKGRATAPLADPGAWWRQHVIRQEIPVFPIRFAHVAQVEAMDWPHQDPYDRILSAQAIVEQATLVTADATILAHAGVPTLW
jgi:PIN domain nuclease of toxin-antitoxin system